MEKSTKSNSVESLKEARRIKAISSSKEKFKRIAEALVESLNKPNQPEYQTEEWTLTALKEKGE